MFSYSLIIKLFKAAFIVSNMQEILKMAIGIAALFLGIPIGLYLASITKEELKQGQKWFKIIIIASLAGSAVFLYLRNDWLFFSFAFVALVTSRSLK